ncbi:kinase-like domain-containing protein, partial [Thamnocephalis sphaerospora]
MDDELDSNDGTLVGRVIRVADLQLRLVSVLGSGAYGTVYLAFDRITAQAYAVKHLPEAHLTSAQRRLQRIEATLHARCNGHPGVLQLHHIVPRYPGVDGWFMVLDYCSEGDLFEYINDGRLGQRTLEREARRLLEEIISAVEWCHRRGVYHRDIKPENVLMRRGADGRMHACLGDFGLATEDAWSTEHGCGSTFYMSPESRSSAAPAPYATQPSDVWSVAVLLVNMTCARNPWRRAERHDATFASFLRDPIGTLTVALPITEGFARVLARCFDPNPVRRCTLEELRQIMRACPRL